MSYNILRNIYWYGNLSAKSVEDLLYLGINNYDTRRYWAGNRDFLTNKIQKGRKELDIARAFVKDQHEQLEKLEAELEELRKAEEPDQVEIENLQNDIANKKEDIKRAEINYGKLKNFTFEFQAQLIAWNYLNPEKATNNNNSTGDYSYSTNLLDDLVTYQGLKEP